MSQRKQKQVLSIPEAPIKYIALNELKLDSKNPRFGVAKGGRANQNDILDFIVENFGIEDVISSLAYNGYFSAEPLIARHEADGSYTVVEGNRRLSACLVLAGDDRASNQARRFSDILENKKSTWTKETTVPVHVFETGDNSLNLNAYLGVRHIMSAKAWDSYAKASWIDDVVSSGQMTLQQIAEVTGDKNRTIQRLLEGYYFINQLKDEGKFIPSDSLRKGRGSNPDFPFSWIYTFLDYSQVRSYLGLSEFDPTNRTPIPKGKTADSAAAISYMFGDRSKARNGLIADSRQLGALASAIADPNKRELLRAGKTVDQIEALSKSPIDQFASSMIEAENAIASALKIVSEGKLDKNDAIHMIGKTRDVAQLSANLFKSLREMDSPDFL
ncbi:hypothetical protein RTH46_13370 [Pseudomonas sp. zfem004]|uniref:ParB N-terminal domain-containing protein n=1 Tax=Pseudomonas sp. zfem004 TaxID=3078199 RepID=UPI002928E49A|nr:ParB N-terminal domain-containing protein [Pseudomonas sp. zfem004]MDU9403476.1 hypothetical protein [Pseudomonas sp. zfem004]